MACEQNQHKFEPLITKHMEVHSGAVTTRHFETSLFCVKCGEVRRINTVDFAAQRSTGTRPPNAI